MKRNLRGGAFTVFVLLLNFYIAEAQNPIPDSLVTERIRVIQTMLDEGKNNANYWWYGWLAGYSAATLVQGTLVFTSDKLATRQDMALGAVTTLLGAAFQLISPMDPGFAPDRLREIPEGTPEEKLSKLNEAEKLLAECAMREKEGRSWKIHVLDGVANVGAGMVVWLGFKRSYVEGIVNTAYNSAICEAQIFTQPTRAIRDYNSYCSQYKPDQSSRYSEPAIHWTFVMVPAGIGIRMVF